MIAADMNVSCFIKTDIKKETHFGTLHSSPVKRFGLSKILCMAFDYSGFTLFHGKGVSRLGETT